jgi:uncharacterized membrane protein (DUF485 family)
MTTQSGNSGTGVGPTAAAVNAEAIRVVALRRSRMAWLLTVILLIIYFAYLLLSAFAKGFMAIQVMSGITVAIVVGFITIIVPWILAWIYLSWANRHHDAACDRISRERTS